MLISEDYFINEQEFDNEKRLTLGTENDSYVLNCYFSSISTDSNGAAIYLNKEGLHFLIEFSSILQCAVGSYKYGGGLYIFCADFAMNHVCAYECKSFHFSFTFVDGLGLTLQRTVNSIHHSSIAYCFAEGQYTMCHASGYIDIQSVNLSHNTASQYSALVCGPDKQKDNIGTNIIYSTIANNTAKASYCLYFNQGENVTQHRMRESNVLFNSQSYHAISTSGQLTMLYCTILENQGSQLFSGSIIMENCSISEDQLETASSVYSYGLETRSFVNGLSFIDTDSCVSTYDLINKLPLAFYNLQFDNMDTRPLTLRAIQTDGFVSNCYFDSVYHTQSGGGGAIYFNKINVRFLLEFSTFIACGTHTQGGALYIYYSNFEMRYVCAVRCNASDGSFAFIEAERIDNSVSYSSIAYSNSGNRYTSYHFSGYIVNQFVNMSHNIANKYSGVYCVGGTSSYSQDANNNGTVISYSSFANNTAKSENCIYIRRATTGSCDKYFILKSNIIRNNASNTITSEADLTLTIHSSSILENRNPAFGCINGANCLIILQECTVSEDSFPSEASWLDTSSIGTKSFIYGLTFHVTGECVNKFERVGGIPLTGLIPQTRPLYF